MPIDVNKDKDGCFVRWGVEGKKYYYECGNEEERNKAKEKAYKQGYAIGDLTDQDKLVQKITRMKQRNLQSNRVSFDYDGVVTKQVIRERIKTLIDAGVDVYIISARDSRLDIMNMVLPLGVKGSNVFAVGSNEEKVRTVKRLRINKHYDNNPNVIKQLPGIGILVR